MSWMDLQDYVRTANDAVNDDEFLMQAYEIATAMVLQYVGETAVPSFVVEEAILKAAAELYHQRETPNGVKQFATFDGGAGIRVTRDPLDAARPILAPWMGFGIA